MLALLLLGSCGTAGAAAYGYAYTSVFGLVISNPTGSTTLLSNIDLSRTTATLNGSSVIHGGANEIDAAQATRGAVSKGQNDFTQQGMGNASFARGDAQIAEQVQGQIRRQKVARGFGIAERRKAAAHPRLPPRPLVVLLEADHSDVAICGFDVPVVEVVFDELIVREQRAVPGVQRDE